MELMSTEIEQGKPIPVKHTADGEDVSPSLSWSEVPDGVEEFALIVDDPDAPTDEPWVHWVVYGISRDARVLPEALPLEPTAERPGKAKQGVNTWKENNLGYRGPAPPAGHGVHHYHFKLYALDKPVEVSEPVDKRKLREAMEGHIVETAELVCTYER
jgi:Raf kinase inhibitor-like YbhB/YbcL family protein